MTPNEYKKKVLMTESSDYHKIKNRLNPKQIRMLHSSIGLCTEAGELIDQLKKHIYYGRELDEANIKEELGDAMWYIFVMLDVRADEFQVFPLAIGQGVRQGWLL